MYGGGGLNMACLQSRDVNFCKVTQTGRSSRRNFRPQTEGLSVFVVLKFILTLLIRVFYEQIATLQDSLGLYCDVGMLLMLAFRPTDIWQLTADGAALTTA